MFEGILEATKNHIHSGGMKVKDGWNGKIYRDSIYLYGVKVKLTDEEIKYIKGLEPKVALNSYKSNKFTKSESDFNEHPLVASILGYGGIKALNNIEIIEKLTPELIKG